MISSNAIFGGVMCCVGILFIGIGIWASFEGDIIFIFFFLVGWFLEFIGVVQLMMLKFGLYEAHEN